MRTIFKFGIKPMKEVSYTCGRNALVVGVGKDPNREPCIWIEHEMTDVPEQRTEISIQVIGTGQPCPSPEESWFHEGHFIDGPFVWHVYVKQ